MYDPPPLSRRKHTRRGMSGHPASEPHIPVEIDDAETIVRAIVAPSHYKKGKVATAAFRPPIGKSAISVMRQLMGDDFCKNKGHILQKNPLTRPTSAFLPSRRQPFVRSAAVLPTVVRSGLDMPTSITGSQACPRMNLGRQRNLSA